MGLTIIIVNWNGGDLLLRCLQSIRVSQTAFEVKVIVVDNDSRDGSRERAAAQFPEFHVLNSGANLGFGRANNLARSMVKTPLVLFLNPDTVLMEDTLEKAVNCLRSHPGVGALGCKMLYPDGTVQSQGLQWFPSPWTIFLEHFLVSASTTHRFRKWLPIFDPRESSYARKLYGGFILAPKSILDAAGWFDDRYFMYAEDVDLSRTIMDLGWKLYYCSEAQIIHECGGTSGQAPSGFSILMKNESINQLMRKYHGWVGAMLHRAVVFFGGMVRLAIALVLCLITFFQSGSGGRSGRWRGALLKQELTILWALGLRKAVIALNR